jgi:hypothetical protein
MVQSALGIHSDELLKFGTPLLMEALQGGDPALCLEARGAIVSLNQRDFVHIDLKPIADFGSTAPETLAHAVLGLRDELRQILIARRTVH